MTLPPTAPVDERVLVLMPTEKDAARTVAILAGTGLGSVACHDLPALCRELAAGAGAVLLTEEALLRDRDGCLPAVLRAQPRWSAVPFVVLSRERPDPPTDVFLPEVAASITLVERPVRMRTLLSVIRAALRARRHQYDVRDAIAARERQAAELEATLQSIPDASYFGTAAGITRCNQKALELFGVGAPADLPKPPATFGETFHIRRPDGTPVPPAALPFVRALAGETVIEEVVFRRPDSGEEVYLRVAAAPVRVDGAIVGAVQVGTDLTAMKRIEAELRQSREELRRQAEELAEAGRRKDEFLATLAHELRNPLAPVRTGLQVLRFAGPGETAARAQEMMERQIAHMVRLIDDLLDVSRITRGKLALRKERADLRAILDSALETSRPLVEGGRHTLSVTVPDGPLPVDADPTRLAQVISNLVNNAAKYTPAGGNLAVEVRRVRTVVSIRVSDNGVGIPADMLPKVFEMFTQVGRSIDRAQGGLGIGLTLVRQLVEMHDGTVDARSGGPGAGSTFTVRLPLAADPPGPAGVPGGPPAPAPPPARRRVLVVDDNRDAAESLAMLLALSGHETRTAHDGPAAIRAVGAFGPEVVVLDIGLPGMNGYEVARQLRADPPAVRPVLIALTGWGAEDDKRQSREAGFDHHLTKPVEPGQVEALLGRDGPTSGPAKR